MISPLSDATKVPNLVSDLLSHGQSGRAERVQTLAQLLSMGVGQTQSAQVEKVAPLTQEQRLLLLNKTLESLVQLEKAPPSPQREQQLDQLQAQQKLLNAPLLKLVKLVLNGRSQFTYTDRPLKPGQTVHVRLADNNRLLLLPQPAPKATLKPHTQTMLGQALRSALSLQSLPTLLEVIPRIQALPLPHRQALLSPNLQQALHAAAQQLRSPAQLAQPQILRAALQTNGVFFEQSLAHNLSRSAPDQPFRFASGKSTQERIGDLIRSGDLKGSLLHTLHTIRTDLKQLGHALPRPAEPGATPTASPTPGMLLGSSANLSQMDLPKLLVQLANRPLAELSSRTLRTQLLVLLHQRTLSSLARIQFQQLQTVTQQQSRAETPQTSQSWTLEIPVRYGLEQHNVSLHFEQDWVWPKEGESSPTTATQRTRRWQVLLSFSLPEAGNVYAQLTLIGESVAAKLWTERQATLHEVNAKLSLLRQQMQDQGIEVTQLDCAQGTPPSKVPSLSYSLVDIRT